MQGNEDKTNKFTNEQLKTMQNWNLERKIAVSKTRIIEFYNEFYDKTNIRKLSSLTPFMLIGKNQEIYARERGWLKFKGEADTATPHSLVRGFTLSDFQNKQSNTFDLD